MTYPLARTTEEALRYLDLHPCPRCGVPDFGRDSVTYSDGADLLRRYAGACVNCGEPREFVFRVPAQPLPPAPPGYARFGGGEPSELLDAGEWLVVSDAYAQGYSIDPTRIVPDQLPRARQRLAYALAALDEAAKFLPPGAEIVPRDALWSERGTELFQREPYRFRRSVIDAHRDQYAGMVQSFARAAGESVGPPPPADRAPGDAGIGTASLALPPPPDAPVADPATGLRRLSDPQIRWVARQLVAAEPLLHRAEPRWAAGQLGWRPAAEQPYSGVLAVDLALGLAVEGGSELRLDEDDEGVASITVNLCELARPRSPERTAFLADLFAHATRTLTGELGEPAERVPGRRPEVRWRLAEVTLTLWHGPASVDLTVQRNTDFDELARRAAEES